MAQKRNSGTPPPKTSEELAELASTLASLLDTVPVDPDVLGSHLWRLEDVERRLPETAARVRAVVALALRAGGLLDPERDTPLRGALVEALIEL
ncbi:MAG: hypothetical protein B7733_17845, partial [Myxococcales bacterium FL481]